MEMFMLCLFDFQMISITFFFALLLSESWSMPGTQWRVATKDKDRQTTQFRPTRDTEIEDRMSRIRPQVKESYSLISEEVISALQVNEAQLDFIEETEDRINPGYKDQRNKKKLRKNRKKKNNMPRMKKEEGERVNNLNGENDIVDSKERQKESEENIADDNEKDESMNEEKKEAGGKENDYETGTEMSESIEVENIFAEKNNDYDVSTEEIDTQSDVTTMESGWWERTKNRFSSIFKAMFKI